MTVANAGERVTGHRTTTPARRIVLFLAAALVAGSANAHLRVEQAGLLLHPYLFAVALLAAFVGVRGITRAVPTAVVTTFMTFFAWFCLVALTLPGGIIPALKLTGFAAPVVVIGGAIRGRADLRAAALGMIGGMTVLSVVALGSAEPSPSGLGINPVAEVGNENAFSLYALPAILLAGAMLTEAGGRLAFRVLVAGCALVTLIAVFRTSSRAGWLGAIVVIALLAARDRRPRTLAAVAAITILLYWALVTFSSTAFLETTISDTRNRQTDLFRRTLFVESMHLGAENPLAGVGPQRVPTELAQRVAGGLSAVEPHNLIAYIWAGTGPIGTVAFGAVVWALWRAGRARAQTDHAPIVRLVLLLWLVLGAATAEVLFAPAFVLAFGVSLGGVRVEEKRRRS